ncbi:MFS transporter [Alkalihalobacillus sp. CinArs1]|uniref:MFS transporter n=1 Tax=Alkalihalobacillus sp. CinArs1 TaxID=2995314 RepID=UPI0022DCE8FF|nr:MFS transporter [Alkalihalobacillus sp. CinArs1]
MMKGITKDHVILLVSIGLSNVGGWIYHIALNLIILDMTKSVLAITALYTLKPLASLLTNGWCGTLIDRLNKRALMIGLALFQSVVIGFLPSLSSIGWIFCMVLLINMTSSIYQPTSMVYLTKFIPAKNRKAFNSIRSLVDSGAFIIGPAIAGFLFIVGTPTYAIYINALALAVSAVIMMALPDVERSVKAKLNLSFRVMVEDWKVVFNYSRKASYIVAIYFLFSAITIMTWGTDSLEAAFSKEVLHLTNSTYGYLVSISGVGILIGATVNTLLIKKLTTSWLLGGGTVVLSIGYIVYALSGGFGMASVGFFTLSFALAFANTGFDTFYQTNVPVEIMGRIGSLFGFIESLLIIIVMGIVGLTAEVISIQFAVVGGSVVMFLLSLPLIVLSVMPSKVDYYSSTASS